MNKSLKNWKTDKLKNVGEIVTGNTPPKKDPNNYGIDYPWVKPEDLNKYEAITKTQEYLSEYGIKKARKLPVGSVLVSCIGNLGKIGYAGTELATNQQINSIVFNPNKIHSKYGYYYCLTLRDWLEQNASATTISIINKTKFQEAPIVFPSLEEQKQIVEKLDAIFEKTKACKERLDKIPFLLKRFRQSVLAAACSGKLTEDWREKNKLVNDYNNKIPQNELIDIFPYAIPANWLLGKFNDIAEVASNLVDPKKYKEKPHIAPDNIQRNTGKLLEYKTINEDKVHSPKHYFYPKQIIYSKIRPYLSKLIVAEFEGLCSADMYPINTSLDVYYLYYYMLSDVFLDFASNAGTRTLLPKINKKELAELPIPIPPKDEQVEIVLQIMKLLKIPDEIESRYNKAKLYFDKVNQSILSKAFKGELL